MGRTPFMKKTVGLAVLTLVLLIMSASFNRAHAGSYYTPDGTRPKDFTLFKVGDTWHLIAIHAYYNPPPGGAGSPGLIHSTSKDMIDWTDVGPAVAVGAPGSWDSYDEWAPTMVKVGNTYNLLYAGVKVGSNPTHWEQKIGRSTSTDLTTWTKDPNNPVFDCSTISWVYWNPSDNEGVGTDCRDPFVIRDTVNNQWVMFYTTRAKPINQSPLTGITKPAIVGMATSTDLATWVDAGYIFTTGGYTTESPHAFEHNGTWWLAWTGNCSWRSSKCLKYATAPALTGPYTGYNDLPGVGPDEYASEYYKDDNGQEYFGRVGWLGGWLDFDYLNWPNNTFTLSETPSGLVTGRVWTDNNGNGLIDPGEGGVGEAFVNIYKDNGDEVFDSNTDTAINNATTFGGNSVLNPIYGTYKIPFFSLSGELPWALLWIQLDPSSLDYTTPPLTGMSPTTPTVIRYDNRAGGLTLSNANFGYNGNDGTPPAAVSDLTPR